MASQAIENTLLAIEKAMQGVDAISETLGRCRDLLEAALTLEDETQRQALKDQFSADCQKINETVALCTVEGLNFLDGVQSQVHVPLSDSNKSNFLIIGSNFTVDGLGFASVEATFHDANALQQTIALIIQARAHAAHMAQTYCANAAVLARHLHSIKR